MARGFFLFGFLFFFLMLSHIFNIKGRIQNFFSTFYIIPEFNGPGIFSFLLEVKLNKEFQMRGSF